MLQPRIDRSYVKWVAFICIYVLILFRWGYEFGRNDQMQTLSYAQYIADHSLYQGDFYLEGIDAHLPNERYIFSVLLSPFAGSLHVLSIIGHAVFALLMLFLLDRIASMFIRTRPFRWLSILLLFIPLYGVGLGGNELYYNSFFVSNVVKTIGLAGIWFMLRHNFFGAFGMFAFATLLQPVVGIQLAITCSGVLLLGMLTRWINVDFKTWFAANIIYAFTGGLWVIFLQVNFESEAPPDPDHFFDILFVFRAPHHYLPSAWHLRDWVVEGLIIITGTVLFIGRDPRFFLFSAISIVLCGVYVLCMEVFELVPAGALQWFKTTIWLEAFCLFAIVGSVEKWLPSAWLNASWWRNLTWSGLLGLGLLCGGWMLVNPQSIPMEVPRDYGQQVQQDDAVKIALQARALTPKDALFIHPMGYTELKFYGQRASYVDYKVLVHTRAAMHVWADKIRTLYGMGWDLPETEDSRYDQADMFFESLSCSTIEALKEEGVTHMLVATNGNTDCGLQKIAQEGKWAIFEL